MTGTDIETKRKLREMGAGPLLEAIEAQEETLVLGMTFEERPRLVVDEAHCGFNHSKVEGLIRRAGLRYPGADLRRLDLVEGRGLDRNVIAQLGTCSFIDRRQNVVFWGSPGQGSRIWGALWPCRPASTGFGPITSVCLTSRNPGRWRRTGPKDRTNS